MPDILLVDDDDNFRTMLRDLLKKLGHTVREARDGGEALELYAKKRSDLVLTDIVMPPPEGLETIYRLRHDDPKCRIIAMSGGGRLNATDYLKIAQMSGANRILHKPFSKDELALAISQAMALTL
ncbi:MAG: response regulator [Verrucomicrobiota bacterium]